MNLRNSKFLSRAQILIRHRYDRRARGEFVDPKVQTWSITMPKFMFLQRGGGCEKPPEMTPEQMEQGMKAWMEWMQNGQEAGWLLDPGNPLSNSGAVVQPDLSVIDGPFAESKELVGGYTIVEAADLAAACELAKQTMKLAGGGKIEVRELANVGADS